MHSFHFALAACMLSLGLPLAAREVTLDEALQKAKTDNTEIKVATLQLSQTRRENSVNDWLPSINLEVGLSTSGSIIDKTFSSSYSLGGISWSIADPSHASNKEKRALSNESAMLTYQSKVNSVESRVTTAYWNAEASRLAWESKQSTLAQDMRDLESVQEKYEAGRATTLAVSQAKMSVADSEYQEQVAHQTYQSALRTLSNLTNLEIDEETTFQEMPETFTLKETEALTSNLGDTTSIRQYKLSIAQAEQTLKSTKASSKGVSVSVSAKTSFGDSIYSYRDGNGSWGFDDFADNTSLGVTVSLPLDHLFKGSSDSVAIDSAEYGVEIAKLNYQKALDDLEDDVKDSVIQVNQSDSNLQLLEDHLSLAKEQLDLVQASYEAGKSSYSELDDAKKTVSDAELSMVQQKLNHTIALYDLATLLECPIENLAN